MLHPSSRPHIAVLLTGGCAIGPDYAPPEQSLTAFRGSQSDAEDLSQWWRRFGDPQLEELIAAAVANNPDLKQARARVLQARALQRASRAGGRPTMDAAATTTRERTLVAAGLDAPVTISLYEIGFDAGREIGLSGGVRRRVEAAIAEAQVAEDDRHAVLISLLSEIARNYVELRGAQAKLRTVKARLAAQIRIVELMQLRCEAEIGTEIDVSRVEALERSTAAAPWRVRAHSSGLLMKIVWQA